MRTLIGSCAMGEHKSRNSARTIPYRDILAEVFASHKAVQEQERKAFGL